jgi:hypothetical protein
MFFNLNISDHLAWCYNVKNYSDLSVFLTNFDHSLDQISKKLKCILTIK